MAAKEHKKTQKQEGITEVHEGNGGFRLDKQDAQDSGAEG
jgi:hypothetical protein